MQTLKPNAEIDLLNIPKKIIKAPGAALLIIVGCILAAAIISLIISPRYTVSATVQIGNINGEPIWDSLETKTRFSDKNIHKMSFDRFEADPDYFFQEFYERNIKLETISEEFRFQMTSAPQVRITLTTDNPTKAKDQLEYTLGKLIGQSNREYDERFQRILRGKTKQIENQLEIQEDNIRKINSIYMDLQDALEVQIKSRTELIKDLEARTRDLDTQVNALMSSQTLDIPQITLITSMKTDSIKMLVGEKKAFEELIRSRTELKKSREEDLFGARQEYLQKISPFEEEIEILYAKSEKFKIVDEAIIPEKPESPNIRLNVMISAFIGVMLSGLYYAVKND